MSSSSSPSVRASSLDRPCTCTGASMMFSSALMCGNRLKCWKTMPMSERTERMCFSPAGLRDPSRACSWYSCRPPTVMVPPSGRSRVISTRRIVVLPDPRRADDDVRSPGSTLRSRSRSTTLSPKALCTPRKRTAAAPLAETSVVGSAGTSGAFVGNALLQSADQPGGRQADEQEPGTGEQERLDLPEGVAADGRAAKNSIPGTPRTGPAIGASLKAAMR